MIPTSQLTRSDASEKPLPSVVGLIGVGLIGSALVERFRGARYSVIGFDVRPDCEDHLRRLGAEPLSRVEDVASRCDRLVLSLPGSDQVRAVLDAIIDHLRPGQIVVDTTTGDPEQSVAAARQLETLGVSFLDATISGSSEQVREGQVTVIAGGSPEAFQACRDLFDVFAKEAHLVGPCGSGAQLKLVSNLILGLNRAAIAEGLALAGAWGLDLRQSLTVLLGSAASSRAMEAKGAKMISGDFAPQARLAQHHKDVRLMLDAAARLGLELPLSQTHDRLLSLAETAGFGELDNSAIIKIYDRNENV